jgi:hypothetical protein
VTADRYPPSPRPPGSAAALFDFLEDALHLFQLIPDLVDPHAEVGQPEVGVLLRGDMPGNKAAPRQ